MLATDDAAQGLRPRFVGDHRHALLQLVFFPVEGQKPLPGTGRPYVDVAFHPVGVEDVERAIVGVGHEVGNVHQRRDGAQADGGEQSLQPFRRWTVLHSPEVAAHEVGAGCRVTIGKVQMHPDRRIESSLEGIVAQRFQPAQTAGRKIARHTVDAQGVRAVRRDGDLDYRIVDAQRLRRRRADRRVLRQFDDAFVVVGDHQLALGAHHARRFHTTHLRHLEVQTGTRHMGARRRENAHQTGAGVGRAADHLHLAVLRFHPADLQLVGVRVLLRGDDSRHREVAQLRAGILHLLDLQADGVQRLDDFLQGGVRIEIFLQPPERELHAESPPESVGTSSARKP